jgi:hypothetical protein
MPVILRAFGLVTLAVPSVWHMAAASRKGPGHTCIVPATCHGKPMTSGCADRQETTTLSPSCVPSQNPVCADRDSASRYYDISNIRASARILSATEIEIRGSLQDGKQEKMRAPGAAMQQSPRRIRGKKGYQRTTSGLWEATYPRTAMMTRTLQDTTRCKMYATHTRPGQRREGRIGSKRGVCETERRYPSGEEERGRKRREKRGETSWNRRLSVLTDEPTTRPTTGTPCERISKSKSHPIGQGYIQSHCQFGQQSTQVIRLGRRGRDSRVSRSSPRCGLRSTRRGIPHRCAGYVQCSHGTDGVSARPLQTNQPPSRTYMVSTFPAAPVDAGLGRSVSTYDR